MRSPLSGRARADVIAVPAPGRLAEGVVVEGSVFAWLFGVKLLRVTADVVLVPAHVRPVDDIDLEPARRVATVSPAGGTDPVERSLLPSTGNGSPTLRAAQQLLRDTDALLGHARRTA